MNWRHWTTPVHLWFSFQRIHLYHKIFLLPFSYYFISFSSFLISFRRWCWDSKSFCGIHADRKFGRAIWMKIHRRRIPTQNGNDIKTKIHMQAVILNMRKWITFAYWEEESQRKWCFEFKIHHTNFSLSLSHTDTLFRQNSRTMKMDCYKKNLVNCYKNLLIQKEVQRWKKKNSICVFFFVFVSLTKINHPTQTIKPLNLLHYLFTEFKWLLLIFSIPFCE